MKRIIFILALVAAFAFESKAQKICIDRYGVYIEEYTFV